MKFVKPAVQQDALKVFFFSSLRPMYERNKFQQQRSSLIINLKRNQEEANE